jgi:hypothetical protein
VHQGDPLGPMLFSLVLQKLIQSIDNLIDANPNTFHAWYLDDGIIAGPIEVVKKVLELLETKGKEYGFQINHRKCETYSKNKIQSLHNEIPHNTERNVELLGAPIGDAKFCKSYIERKQKEATVLLSMLPKIGNPQVALLLLRKCASFCKIAHLARSTPPSEEVVAAFAKHDINVMETFEAIAAIELNSEASAQCQLGLRNGGIGLRALVAHAPAAYIASSLKATTAPRTERSKSYLSNAVQTYNTRLGNEAAATVDEILDKRPNQHDLSQNIEKAQFKNLFDAASTVTKTRLLSISAPQAHAWLTCIPSPGLGLTIEPEEMQVLLQWWLGLPLFTTSDTCGFCQAVLDQQGQHAMTCRCDGDVVSRHNHIRNALFDMCSRALLSPQLEKGSHATDQTRPADILIPNWSLATPAALDVRVINPLNNKFVSAASITQASTAALGEEEKHNNNDTKCKSLGWKCIPLVVEVFGCWGNEAHTAIRTVANKIAVQTRSTRAEVTQSMYSRLGIVLMRSNARSVLKRRLLASK